MNSWHTNSIELKIIFVCIRRVVWCNHCGFIL